MNTLCMQVIPSVHQGSLTFFCSIFICCQKYLFLSLQLCLLQIYVRMTLLWKNAPKDLLENERSKLSTES